MNRRAHLIGISLIVALLALGTLSACGSNSSSNGVGLVKSGVLTIGSDETYPPMESQNSSTGKAEGADIDLGNAIAKQMGLKASFHDVTFDSLIPDMTGVRHPFDVIMSSMNDTAARRGQGVRFVDYMHAVEAIVVNSSSSVHASSYSGMCGTSISVETGTTEEAGIEAANKNCSSKMDMHSFATDTEAFQAFKSGHVQSYSTDLPVAAGYVNGSKGSYRLAGPPIQTGENYGIGMDKSNHKLYLAVAKAFQKVKSSGRYLAILKKWGVQGGAL